ncbi:MAG: hypothetical protein ACRDTG_23625 [Pseudonocardiaceae bacterium]
MTLVILSVIIIALLVAVLAIYLFLIGVLLNNVANNLDDCLESVQRISRHAAVIGPGVKRLNQTGKDLVGAMPLLYGGAESLITKLTPAAAPTAATKGKHRDEPSLAAVPVGVGYMDK